MEAKNTEADNSVFVEKLFGSMAPIPAELQKETFGNILEQTADEECNLHLVKLLKLYLFQESLQGGCHRGDRILIYLP